MKRVVVGLLLALMALAGCSDTAAFRTGTHREALVLVDWSSGVSAANHPEGAGQYGVWYDATESTFGTPSASTLNGLPAMRIDDGGFVNGVYAIYAGAIPASGTYRLDVTLHVVESAATTTNGVDAYRVGVAVGAAAAHRGPNPSALAGLGASGAYTGLTDGDDTAAGPQLVSTSEFTASAGDDLLIAFGTDVASGAWNQAPQTWNGTYVLVGAIELVPVATTPSNVVDNDQGAPGYTETGPWATGGSVGHGGTYRFATAGNAATASFTRTLDPGFYEVEAIYRAGQNRASLASYRVALDGVTAFETLVDQRFQDQVWVPLGLLDATNGGVAEVVLDAQASSPAGQVVIADAVRFVPSAGPPPIDPPEVRMASITVFDPIADVGAIQSTVNRLAKLRYNSVAVHTRFRGDATYFPNKTDATHPNSEPRSPQAGAIDVLGEFVTRGHAAGLRVFAYVNTHLVTDGDDTAADPAHVLNTHPEWRTYAYNGGSPVVQTTAHDPEGAWIDPALPAARQYLVDVIADIAKNYEIDGVILDRIRYPQTSFTRTNRDFGYHPQAVAAFNKRYGKTGIPDPYDADWIEFRQRAITDTVGAIHEQLRSVNPSALLLAFPIGRFNDALQFSYQDWPTWMSENKIDGVFPQIYSADLTDFSARLSQHQAAYGGDRLLGVTLNAFTPGIDIAAQIELARAAGFDGASPFRHGVMDALGYNEALGEAWPGIAPFPETPWHGADVAKLSLHRSCADPVPGKRKWRIANPNAWAIEVEWWVLGSAQHGSFWAPPGDSIFETNSVKGINLVLVAWRDEDYRQQFALQLGLESLCW